MAPGFLPVVGPAPKVSDYTSRLAWRYDYRAWENTIRHARKVVADEEKRSRGIDPDEERRRLREAATQPSATYRTLAAQADSNAHDAMKVGAYALGRVYRRSHERFTELAEAAVERERNAEPTAQQLADRAALAAGRERVTDMRLYRELQDRQFPLASLGHQQTDADLAAWANRRAAEAEGIKAAAGPDLMMQTASLVGHWQRWGLEAPKLNRQRTPAGVVARMIDKLQWRRAARMRWAQLQEMRAIDAGKVHRRAGLYVSDAMLRYVKQRRSETRELLEQMIAVSSEGETIDLLTAVDASNANPKVRRHEMMARIVGLDDLSVHRGDAAIFLTLSLASRYHSHCWRDGKVTRNPKWDEAGGALPREGQQRLAELWDEAIRTLRKAGVQLYGLRTVQPHHDGTPHWHVLLFCDPVNVARINLVMRETFLQDDPDEAGAKEHRVDSVLIDRTKGSAVGYVSRYIARAINGADLRDLREKDDDGVQRKVAESISGVERVTAWASVWRIRLFQFVGTPPQTWAREFRRMDGPLPDWTLETARDFADLGDYCNFTDFCGGPAVAKKHRPFATWREPGKRLNRYEEPRPDDVKGVQLNIDFYLPKHIDKPAKPLRQHWQSEGAAALMTHGYSMPVTQWLRRSMRELYEQRWVIEQERFGAALAAHGVQQKQRDADRLAWLPVRALSRTKEWTLKVVKQDQPRAMTSDQRAACDSAWTRYADRIAARGGFSAFASPLGALSITVPATAGDAANFQASPPPAVSDRRPPANSPARPPPS